MCDPLGDDDVTVEEDPLGYNEELEVKDEPFEFFDDPVSSQLFRFICCRS